MIERFILPYVRRLAKQFPAVLILGPRQCGKTTFARAYCGGSYFDLEKPSDLQIFASDIEGGLRRFGEPLVLDEAHRLPALFTVLRSLIDENRRQPGRFILLGSVDPALRKEVSESLAGRVGVAELTPLLFRELKGVGLERYWHRGGFPDALLAADDEEWDIWQKNYVLTFVERDLARAGLRQSPEQLRTLLAMLASQQGGLLNASALGRSLGVSYHAVERALDLFEGHFLIRRLLPFHASLGKRLVKAPKVYIRDSGLLHHLVGVNNEEALKRSPVRGGSWEGLVVENTLALESLARPSSRFFFYRTHTGEEVDLVVERGQTRLGIEIKCSTVLGADDAQGLRRALRDGVITHGAIVYQGVRAFTFEGNIQANPASSWLAGKWNDGYRVEHA